MTEADARLIARTARRLEPDPINGCLRHADYHVMGQDCWNVVLDWFFEHSDLSSAEQRAAYRGAWERKILDGFREGTT